MTAEVSPAQYPALSFTMPLDVHEDYAEELEDFIHLAHVGCVEAAEDVYHGVLKQHALGSFPILAEYLELLLDNGRYSKVLTILEGTTGNNFTKAERQFLELAELLSRCRLDLAIMSDREVPCWSKIDFTLTDVLRRYLNSGMMDLELEQGDLGLEVRHSFLYNLTNIGCSRISWRFLCHCICWLASLRTFKSRWLFSVDCHRSLPIRSFSSIVYHCSNINASGNHINSCHL